MALLASVAAATAETIEMRTVHHHTTVRAVAFAQKSQSVSAHTHSRAVEFVAPDGVGVETNEMVLQYDLVPFQDNLFETRSWQKTIGTRRDRTVAEIAKSQIEIENDLTARRAQLAALEARQTDLLALPDTNAIAIAETQLHVATTSFRAASNDVRNARSRCDGGMISRDSLRNRELTLSQRLAILDHARKRLAYVRRPADPLLLKRVALNIAIAREEIPELEHAVREGVRIGEILRKSANARLKRTELSTSQRIKDIEKATKRAERPGNVLYTLAFHQLLVSGRAPWGGFHFLDIPEPDTLALKGAIPETQRPFFAVGDRATIRTAGAIAEGSVSSIAEMPRDSSEKKTAGWNEAADSGVKVYDIVITPDKLTPDLFLGMTAFCELTSSQASTRASVPTSFVRVHDGDYYLSFDGQYVQVKGKAVGKHFILEDDAMLGKEVARHGTFEKPDAAAKAEDEQESLSISGELVPSRSVDVTVGVVRFWPNIVWLIDEDSIVKEGDVVARLEDDEVSKRAHSAELSLEGARGDREAKEEQEKLDKRARALTLAKEQTKLNVARIDAQLAEQEQETDAILDQGLAVAEKQLLLEHRRAGLSEHARKSTVGTNDAVLAQLKRDATLAELDLEKARIELRILERGTDELAVRAKKLACLKQSLKTETLAMQHKTDAFAADRTIYRAKRQEAGSREYWDTMRTQQTNTAVVAPCDGIVRYARTWTMGGFSKTAVGSQAGTRTRIAQIVDTSDMYVRLEVPERYFTETAIGMTVDVAVASARGLPLKGKVTNIPYKFEQKHRPTTPPSLYSAFEPIGEAVFFAHVTIEGRHDVTLKPGEVAHVTFPFNQ